METLTVILLRRATYSENAAGNDIQEFSTAERNSPGEAPGVGVCGGYCIGLRGCCRQSHAVDKMVVVNIDYPRRYPPNECETASGLL